MPPVQHWPRGEWNALHSAAQGCSEELVAAILSWGSVDIDQGNPEGYTPLFLAVLNGGIRVVRMLLKHGANVAIAVDGGITPLHICAQEGHVVIEKMLVTAGADVDAATPNGTTPLDLAAGAGHSKMIASLVEDGANVNSRLHECGGTPLVKAAFFGHLEAVRELLRAKADPLLIQSCNPAGQTCVALDVAAQNGHLEVVREMIQQLGIEGCGGATGGVDALEMAAGCGRVDVMAYLTSVGVADTGDALAVAAETSQEVSVKFLLQQQEGKSTDVLGSYVNNTCGFEGETPLLSCIARARRGCQRVARRLIDAGADPAFVVSSRHEGHEHCENCSTTPLDHLSCLAREKIIHNGEAATEEQLLSFEGIRRLLLRVDAVRAVSWLWPRDATTTRVVRAARSTGGTKRTSTTARTPLVLMLPALGRRNERRRCLLAALFRYSGSRRGGPTTVPSRSSPLGCPA